MSPEDLQQIRSRLSGAESVLDVITRIGKPDREFPGTPDEFRTKLYGGKRVLRQLDYVNLSATVQVSVQEHEDASIHINYSGKFIGKPRTF
jgi:hypothetical protein